MKQIRFIIMLLMLAAAGVVRGESDSASAKLSDFKLPQYDKDGKLIFILYGKGGNSAGINIFLEKVLIDLVQSNIKDIDTVKDFQNLEIYGLEEPTANIIKFWAGKPHSAAVITTPSAIFDRSTQTVKGDREIHFRSSFLDIDGEGFDGDHQAKTLHIRKNVRMVVRSQLARMTMSAGKDKKEAGAHDGATTEKSSNKDMKKDDVSAK